MSIYDKKSKNFFNILPRSRKYLDYNMKPLTLRVSQSKGVEVIPDVDFTVNDLSKGKKQYVNHSGKCDRFKVTIIIRKTDTRWFEKIEVLTNGAVNLGSVIDYTGEYGVNNLKTDWGDFSYVNTDYYKETFKKVEEVPVTKILDYYIKNGEPVYVGTNAMDIPNDYYLIIANSSRKQSYEETVEWELEFIRYRDFSIASFKNTNKAVKKAVKKYNNKKKAKAKKAKQRKEEGKSLKKKLKKCDRKKLVYSKKKKTVDCVKTLQLLLIYYKVLKDSKDNKDGWFGKVTVDAVKKFQKRYKEKYKLTDSGKVDAKTFKALYTGGSSKVQVGETKTIKSNLPTGIIKSK